jgi:hypothetical protein
LEGQAEKEGICKKNRRGYDKKRRAPLRFFVFVQLAKNKVSLPQPRRLAQRRGRISCAPPDRGCLEKSCCSWRIQFLAVIPEISLPLIVTTTHIQTDMIFASQLFIS